MATRRRFLKSAGVSGIAFCSCCLLDAARAQAPAPARRPVTVAGRRVRTVDAHAHCYFQDALDLMGADAAAVLRQTKGVPEHFLGVDGRLAAMDGMGIDMEVLSINPFWYSKDRETAAKIVAIHNERFAQLCAAQPERFAAFASITLQYPDLAVQQLDDAVRK